MLREDLRFRMHTSIRCTDGSTLGTVRAQSNSALGPTPRLRHRQVRRGTRVQPGRWGPSSTAPHSGQTRRAQQAGSPPELSAATAAGGCGFSLAPPFEPGKAEPDCFERLYPMLDRWWYRLVRWIRKQAVHRWIGLRAKAHPTAYQNDEAPPPRRQSVCSAQARRHAPLVPFRC